MNGGGNMGILKESRGDNEMMIQALEKEPRLVDFS